MAITSAFTFILKPEAPSIFYTLGGARRVQTSPVIKSLLETR